MSKIAERTGLIWVPDDTIDLLSVSVDGHASDEEVRGMIAINQAARDWLTGEIETDVYLDKLEHYHVYNPYELVDEFSEHVEYIYSHG